jgi:hypothetical protein
MKLAKWGLPPSSSTVFDPRRRLALQPSVARHRTLTPSAKPSRAGPDYISLLYHNLWYINHGMAEKKSNYHSLVIGAADRAGSRAEAFFALAREVGGRSVGPKGILGAYRPKPRLTTKNLKLASVGR